MMTQKEADAFGKACREYTKNATTSKRKARATLVRLGIYTKGGKLTKRFK